MQLDRVPPRKPAAEVSGTPDGSPGVIGLDRMGDAGSVAPGPPMGARLTWRGALMIGLAALSLTGQGERFRVDPRFATPSATISTYWQALRSDDEGEAAECLVDARDELPFPGMLWFLPPTRDLWLEEFRLVQVSSGRVMMSYQVRYRPVGTHLEQSFVTGSELVRQRGEWRIARPLGEASIPDWRPIPRTVDI